MTLAEEWVTAWEAVLHTLATPLVRECQAQGSIAGMRSEYLDMLMAFIDVH